MAYGGVASQAASKVPLDSVPYYAMLHRRGSRSDSSFSSCTVYLDRLSAPSSLAGLEPPSIHGANDINLLAAMHNLLNFEIVERGNSYPFERALSFNEFLNYYAAHEVFALRLVAAGEPSIAVGDVTRMEYHFGCHLVGSFYVKPNYPARSAHVCNGGFLVVPSFRGCGVGALLGQRYQIVARELGFRASMFNLVYRDNAASVRLWTKLGFTHLSTIPHGGRVLSAAADGQRKEIMSDAFQFYLDLEKRVPTVPKNEFRSLSALLQANKDDDKNNDSKHRSHL